MLDLVFNFFSVYLIEFMGSMLAVALIFRWSSWKQSKEEDSYFTSFTSEIEKVILLEKDNNQKVSDVEFYLNHLMDEVKEKLPTRAVRNNPHKNKPDKAKELGAKNVVSLREYVQGDQSLFLGIKSEMASFKSKYPPNFNQLTDRILQKDDKWNKLMKFFPLGPISRLIDILPGLFVVFGIFGTFIGISMALPKIAEIDFNNLEASGVILTQFVHSVTYAMKTSIAGILFSLIMTFLNTVAPVKGLRMQTFKKISNCFEGIWQSIHGDKTVEQELHDVMPELLKEVKEIKSKLAKADESDAEKSA